MMAPACRSINTPCHSGSASGSCDDADLAGATSNTSDGSAVVGVVNDDDDDDNEA